MTSATRRRRLEELESGAQRRTAAGAPLTVDDCARLLRQAAYGNLQLAGGRAVRRWAVGLPENTAELDAAIGRLNALLGHQAAGVATLEDLATLIAAQVDRQALLRVLHPASPWEAVGMDFTDAELDALEAIELDGDRLLWTEAQRAAALHLARALVADAEQWAELVRAGDVVPQWTDGRLWHRRNPHPCGSLAATLQTYCVRRLEEVLAEEAAARGVGLPRDAGELLGWLEEVRAARAAWCAELEGELR